MRIATWNVERLKHKSHLDRMIFECESICADILVLTETDACMKPSFQNCFQTPILKGITCPAIYADTENRVSIFTNYKCVKMHPTYDVNTALCVELETPKGNLLVYGTIIGILGNSHAAYSEDLKRQLEDINRFIREGHNICMAGDFNCTFCDNYYFTKYGRNTMVSFFAQNNISILTRDTAQCVDHIAISRTFIENANIHIAEWNFDKRLSDHKGIVAEI